MVQRPSARNFLTTRVSSRICSSAVDVGSSTLTLIGSVLVMTACQLGNCSVSLRDIMMIMPVRMVRSSSGQSQPQRR